MSLNNAQFDALMRIYSRRRFEALDRLNAHKAALYAQYPNLSELQDQLAENAAARAKAAILDNASEQDRLLAERDALTSRRAELYEAYGIDPRSLELTYACPDCRDTGFIGNRKCHCFIRAEIALLYRQSHLSRMLETENFDHLDLSLYSRESRDGRPSQYEQMTRVIRTCRDYVETFDREHRSLFFYGRPGLGKTFLTNCIAKELLDTCHSVIYFSAVQLFELFSATRFRETDEEEAQTGALTDSDLLIIDDLGTETPTAYTRGRFFSLINERLLAGRGTIISTNLTLNDLPDRYEERTASRILSAFTLLPLYGDDLRIKIKLKNINPSN